MKRKFYAQVTFVLGLIFSVALAAGCGENLFYPLVGDSAQNANEQAADLLDNAVTIEDFIKAKEAAQRALDNATTTDDRQQALSSKGSAILGENGVTVTDVFAEIVDAASATSSTDNMFNIIPSANPDDIKAAADAFNDAASLNASTTLDANVQLNRGMTNTLVAVNMVTSFFDIEGDDVSNKDSSTSVTASIKALVDPDDGKSLQSYVSNASSSFNEAGALDDDQTAQVDQVSTATDELVELNAILDPETSTTTNYTSPSGTTYDLDPDSPDYEDNINEALGDIFGGL